VACCYHCNNTKGSHAGRGRAETGAASTPFTLHILADQLMRLMATADERWRKVFVLLGFNLPPANWPPRFRPLKQIWETFLPATHLKSVYHFEDHTAVRQPLLLLSFLAHFFQKDCSAGLLTLPRIAFLRFGPRGEVPRDARCGGPRESSQVRRPRLGTRETWYSCVIFRISSTFEARPTTFIAPRPS